MTGLELTLSLSLRIEVGGKERKPWEEETWKIRLGRWTGSNFLEACHSRRGIYNPFAAFEQAMVVSLLPRTCPENLYLGDSRTQVRRLWPLWGWGDARKLGGIGNFGQQENEA